MCLSMLGYFLLNFEPVVVEVFAFFLSGPLPSSGPCSKDKEEVKKCPILQQSGEEVAILTLLFQHSLLVELTITNSCS